MSKFNYKRSACLSYLLVLICSTSTFAEDVNIGVHLVPPFVIENENKDVDGVAVRLTKEVFCRLGSKVSLRVAPWSRAFLETQQGNNDVLLSAYRNKERDEFFYFSTIPIALHKNIVVKLKSFSLDKGNVTSLADLAHYKTDYVRNFSLGSVLDKVKGQYIGDKGHAKNPELATKLLLSGRIELLIIEKNMLDYYLAAPEDKELVDILPLEIPSEPAYIAFYRNEKGKRLRDNFDQAMLAIKRDQTEDTIKERYQDNLPFQCSMDTLAK